MKRGGGHTQRHVSTLQKTLSLFHTTFPILLIKHSFIHDCPAEHLNPWGKGSCGTTSDSRTLYAIRWEELKGQDKRYSWVAGDRYKWSCVEAVTSVLDTKIPCRNCSNYTTKVAVLLSNKIPVYTPTRLWPLAHKSLCWSPDFSCSTRRYLTFFTWVKCLNNCRVKCD